VTISVAWQVNLKFLRENFTLIFITRHMFRAEILVPHLQQWLNVTGLEH
jgi:hypothetical protein